MYIFQNALKNIGRNKGRNIISGTIVCVMILTCVVSLAINNAAGSIITESKNRYGSQVSVELDFEKLQSTGGPAAMTDISAPSSEDLIGYAKSRYVKDYALMTEVPATSETLKGKDENNGSGAIMAGGEGMKMPKMKVRGYSKLDMLDEFTEGKRVIDQGKMFKNKGECVVSSEFAELNNLKVGDTIEVSGIMKEDAPVTLTVSGIYNDYTKENESPMKDAFMNRRNELITGFETAKMLSSGIQGAMVNVKYTLTSPDVKDAFEAELREQGLSSYFRVTTDESLYEKVVGPVESLATISFVFMIVVLLLGGTILVLINMMALRERKYEIGVLRAMGMKKMKVALGLIYELLAVTFAAMILAVGIGAMVSQPISDGLLASQVQAASEAAQKAMGNMGGMAIIGPQSDAEAISQLAVGINPIVLFEICGIAILLAALSGAVSLSYITKYEPIKILTERN